MGQLDKRRRYTKKAPVIILDWLKFTAVESGTFTFTISQMVQTTTLSSISYSVDNGLTWVKTNNQDSTVIQITTPTIQANNSVYWKGEGVGTANSAYFSLFSSTCRYFIMGNIMSLLYGDDFEDKTQIPSTYCFHKLFVNNTKLLQVIATSTLPATTLTDSCYYCMFKGCTSLTIAPRLIAKNATTNCYYSMFEGCTSLTSAPTISATTLALNCYNSMFKDCTSLKTAPILYARTLAVRCYDSMFYGCTSLTTAPILHAITLAIRCCRYMFYGCTSLTTAPVLYPVTLVSECYSYMFKGCSALNYIKALFINTIGTNYTDNWVDGVAATGTFVRHKSAQYTISGGPSTIPSGWTIQTATA